MSQPTTTAESLREKAAAELIKIIEARSTSVDDKLRALGLLASLMASFPTTFP